MFYLSSISAYISTKSQFCYMVGVIKWINIRYCISGICFKDINNNNYYGDVINVNDRISCKVKDELQ